MRAIKVTLKAENEIRQASLWWELHRTTAHPSFQAELKKAFLLIAAHPFIGTKAANTRLTGVRRLVLTKTGYQLFYRVVGDTVQVLSFWHERQGAGPGL